MAKKSTTPLAGKKFFSIVVLSVATLGLIVTTMAVQQQTSTESKATGGNYGSLSNCNIKNGRAGGVALYNGSDQTGGYRIMCIKFRSSSNQDTEIDKNLGSQQSGDQYYDIWNFNNKTDSLKLRANPWCIVTIELFDGNLDNNLLWTQQLGDNTTGTKYERNFNLPQNKINKATSLRMKSQCVKSRIPIPTPSR